MLRRTITRRGALTAAVAAVTGLAGRRGRGGRSTAAQDSWPVGRIAFVRRGDVWVWQNGEESRVIENGAASDPRWSPSGRYLLYVRTGDSHSDLYLRDLQLGGDTQLTYNESWQQMGSPDYVLTSSWALDPDWSPSGMIAFASDNTGDESMILWLLSDPSLSPEPAPIAGFEDDIEGVSLSSDGSVAAYTVRLRDDTGANTTYVTLRDLSDGALYPFVEDPRGAFDPAIAPDDQRVAVAIRGKDGVTDIWMVARATGDRARVTTNAQATKPTWSPDGQWLAYLRMVDFRFECWASPVTGDGFGEPRRLFRYQNLDGASRVSWTLT